MTVPAVRPPSPIAGSGPARPPAGQAAKFSELLRQPRRPVEPPPGPEDPMVPLGDPTPPPRTEAVAPREDDRDLAPEPDPPVNDVAPAAVTPTPWVLPDAHCRAAMREVALTIAGFCNDPAVNNGELWQVQMALRADVVPDTTLHLSLSPHWLTLRFHAADPAALDLLSRGREALVEVLETTLARKRDIAITFDPP